MHVDGLPNLSPMPRMSLRCHGFRTTAAIMWYMVMISLQTAAERIVIDMSRQLADF